MNRRLYSFLALMCLMISPHVGAEMLAPSGRNTMINITFDRMSVPAKLPVWVKEHGGYDTLDAPKWGRNTLTCLSRTDTQFGACPTQPVWMNNINLGPYPVAVTFTEATTGQTLVLSVDVVQARAYGFSSLSTESYPMEGSVAKSPNQPTASNGKQYSAWLSAAELKKIPSTGTWSATLKMALRQWTDCSGGITNDLNIGCPGALMLADWVASITLKITDYGNQQIYLPEFGNAAPLVDLGLKIFSATQAVTAVKGHRSLDMCLYDGNDAASNRISLLLEDEGAAAPGRASGRFSIYLKGGDKNLAENRVDYSVEVINPLTGGRQGVRNGREIQWSGTNQGKLRRVVLPGQRNSVLCVPAPLELITPAFNLAGKTAGRYQGTLRVIFTPTTQ